MMEIDNRGYNPTFAWIILALVIGFILYINYGNNESRSSDIYDDESGTFSRGDIINTTDDVDSEITDESEYGPYDDYGEYGIDGYPETNKCGYENYGYPSYLGTDKDGKICSDFVEGDFECIANPPYNYDGEILISYSNPKLTCCVEDGTCQW